MKKNAVKTLTNVDYKALAKEFGTPFYLYDFDLIRANFLALKSAFAARKSQIFYAVKANSNLSLLKMLTNLDSGFDCVSIGEVKRALKAGAKAYKIIFSGVGKSESELEFALKCGILYINLESEAEMLLLEKIAQKLGAKARISVRVNPNVDAKTHPTYPRGLLKTNSACVWRMRKKCIFMRQRASF